MNLLYEIRWNWRYWLTPPVRFAVITDVDEEGEGNESHNLLVKRPRIKETLYRPDGTQEHIMEPTWVMTENTRNDDEFLVIRTPVFQIGEVLLIGRTGREVVGAGRKPSKWFVEYETFWFRRSAIKRARKAIRDYVNRQQPA